VRIIFKEAYKAEHLKALSTPHSKAKAKPMTTNSSCLDEGSRTSNTDAREMVIMEVSERCDRRASSEHKTYSRLTLRSPLSHPVSVLAATLICWEALISLIEVSWK